MRRLEGAGVGGAECRRKAKSSNALAAVTSNEVEGGTAEGKRRGENKYLVEKMRQNLRTAFELHTRSVPFRCAALRTKPGQTG